MSFKNNCWSWEIQEFYNRNMLVFPRYAGKCSAWNRFQKSNYISVKYGRTVHASQSAVQGNFIKLPKLYLVIPIDSSLPAPSKCFLRIQFVFFSKFLDCFVFLYSARRGCEQWSSLLLIVHIWGTHVLSTCYIHKEHSLE